MKNKKTIFAVAGICLLGIIAGTFAYFSTKDLFHNLFTTDYYQIDTYEVFESPENWKPGDTTPKTISVTNNGNVDAAVRISFTEEWADKNGGYLYTTQDSKSAAIINFADDYEENWQSIGEWNASVYTKYYYFRNKLSPGETTPNLIESVTFNPEFVARTKETCVTDDATHKKSCTVTPGGYEDATYKLTIKIETVQYNMYKTAWNTSAKIYTSHPYNFSDHIRSLVDTDDVANDDPNGNYRYIGTSPKNYVRYNNELWRILGSYDYGYVKIIRDEPLGQFCFDSSEHSINNGKGINDWSQAKLMEELNGDYVDTKLTEDARWYTYLNLEKEDKGIFNHNYVLSDTSYNMIGWGTWYLGCPNNNNGSELSFDDDTFTPSNLFYNEKSSKSGKICTSDVSDCTDTYTRKSTWSGKVALINISDYIYSTSGGDTVSREQCINSKLSFFNDNSECGNNSWLTNLQSGDTTTNQYTITPAATNTGGQYVFAYNNEGKIIMTGTPNALFIHPVVQLFSDIVYLTGTGTHDDPYIIER